jgi:hypothetical protein
LLTDVVPRSLELGRLAAQLASGTSGLAVAWLHGGPGTGKSTLAALWAASRSENYPGGVVWVRFGFSARTPEDAASACRLIASVATRTPVAEMGAQAPDAGDVRSQFAHRGRLLVVVDDAWAAAPLSPVLDLLPAGTHVVVTTRLGDLAAGRGIRLRGMQEGDAVAMLSGLDGLDRDAAAALARGLGYHPMALQVARGALGTRALASRADAALRIVDRVKEGSGLGGLPGLRPDEREQEFEAALGVSYDFLGELSDGPQRQRQFRSLGAFTSAGSFDAEAACAVLGTDPDEGVAFLEGLCGLNLLDAEGGPTPRFSQHALLGSYCHALLAQAGEAPAAEERHVAWYAEQAVRANEAGMWFPLAPDTEQLAHAMQRAVDTDLGRATELLGATGDLFLTLGRSGQHVRLAERFRDRAVATAEPEIEALGHAVFGAAAVRSASALAGEERQARLDEAVAAYREALVFYTAERAPMDYAMTQTNLQKALKDLGTDAGTTRRLAPVRREGRGRVWRWLR